MEDDAAPSPALEAEARTVRTVLQQEARRLQAFVGRKTPGGPPIADPADRPRNVRERER